MTIEANGPGREMDWEESLDESMDKSGFVVLPPGNYPFTIKGFARKRSKGSEKIPPSPMAEVEVEVKNPDTGDSVTMRHFLVLHTKLAWKLAEFFRSIGARKHGESYVMDWSKVPGSTGICKVAGRRWQAKDGTWKDGNEIDRFMDPDAKIGAAPASAAGLIPVTAEADAAGDIPF